MHQRRPVLLRWFGSELRRAKKSNNIQQKVRIQPHSPARILVIIKNLQQAGKRVIETNPRQHQRSKT